LHFRWNINQAGLLWANRSRTGNFCMVFLTNILMNPLFLFCKKGKNWWTLFLRAVKLFAPGYHFQHFIVVLRLKKQSLNPYLSDRYRNPPHNNIFFQVEKRSNEDLQGIHNIGKYLITNKAYGDSGHRDSYLQVHNSSYPWSQEG